MPETPAFQIENELDAGELARLLPSIVNRSLPDFLSEQRWYGDKARQIRRVELATHSVIPLNDCYLALARVTVSFDQGSDAEYSVPLVTVAAPVPATSVVTEIVTGERHWIVADAAHSPAFRQWLLEELSGSNLNTTSPFRWIATSVARDYLQVANQSESRVSSAQQSNSSIVYGDSIILKIFRRLAPGINPEVELGRFLTTRTAFRNIPLMLGEWSETSPDGQTRSLGVAQTFVPSIGDGWSHTLRTLKTPDATTDTDARRLGQLTAQMHLALASARADPDLVPEPILAGDAATWAEGVNQAVLATASALRRVQANHVGETRELIEAFLSLSPRLASQAAGFERLIGRDKTRVHGDYHLGQTIRTYEGDFVILDFEGEPQRSIEERRLKTSPLKDVAGMLRSFGYARGAAEREATDETGRASLIAWERATRRAFVDAYVEESRRGLAGYLPSSDDDIRQALAAWELDKALYEVMYELNNRPDWLALPLAATLKLA